MRWKNNFANRNFFVMYCLSVKDNKWTRVTKLASKKIVKKITPFIWLKCVWALILLFYVSIMVAIDRDLRFFSSGTVFILGRAEKLSLEQKKILDPPPLKTFLPWDIKDKSGGGVDIFLILKIIWYLPPKPPWEFFYQW